MNPVCVFLRVYNDADHLSPVIWKFLDEGHPVEVILLDKNLTLDYDTDPRLGLLRKFPACRMVYYYATVPGLGFLKKFSLARFRNPFIKKIANIFLNFLKRFVLKRGWAEQLIASRRPLACVFDSCEMSPDTLEGRLAVACKKFHVPLVCLPHGMHYITSYGSASEQLKRLGDEEYFSFRDTFDVIVEPNPLHHFGPWDQKLIERKKIVFLGSARYCPEWFSMARNFWPDFKAAKSDAGKFKLLFFLPRWEKTVDKEGVLEALGALASDSGVYLAVKEHTREGAGTMPHDLRMKLANAGNVELVSGSTTLSLKQWLASQRMSRSAYPVVDSVALVRWCDAAINIRSSVGLEVILQNKVLFNPVYLCSDKTIFDRDGAGIECGSLQELLAAVQKCRVSKGDPRAFYDSSFLIKNSVYAGQGPHDVLSTYTRLIQSFDKGAFPERNYAEK